MHLANVILVVSSLFVFGFYSHPADFEQAFAFLPILLLAIPFQYLTETQIAVHRSYFNNKLFAWHLFIMNACFFAVKYLLASLFGVLGAVSASVLVYLVFSIIYSIYIKKKYFAEKTRVVKLANGIKKQILSYSFQYMITNGVTMIIMLNEVFLLGRFLGDSQIVANYKVANVLPANLSMFSGSIGLIVAPYFMKHEDDTEWVKNASRKTVLLTITLIGALVAILYFFAEPLIIIFYSSDYVEVVPVMRILLIASLINNGVRSTYAYLLSAMGKVKYNLIVSILAVFLQLAVNRFTIPVYGVMGLAVTSAVLYATMGIALYFIFNKVISQ